MPLMLSETPGEIMYPSNIRQKISDDALMLGTSMFSLRAACRRGHISDRSRTGSGPIRNTRRGARSRLGLSPYRPGKPDVALVIRVAWNDPGLIKKAYDVGAVGVMVPQVEGPDEAAMAIQYAKYPPIGNRGIAPWFASHARHWPGRRDQACQ